MSSRPFRLALVDQRGIALPLALIVLTLLTSLTLAFLAMSASEPMIAANHKGGEQALMLAEAGIERALWALSNPTVDTAGVNTKLSDLNAIPAAYNGQTLFTLPTGGFSVTITGAGPTTITGHGYVVRNGVALPAQPGGLAQSDIAAHRVVQLRLTSTGPVGGQPIVQNLPGALAVAGKVQMSGNSLVDGFDKAKGQANNCATKAGVTVRDKTTLSDGTVQNNTADAGGSAQQIGSPGAQIIPASQFGPYLFSQSQLDGLKALAQSQGTYIQPSSNAQFILTVSNGLTFVDTVNGAALGNPPDASKLASVKITGANNSGWLIVMGSVRIDGNVTYNGFIYAHNDFSYKGSGQGGIYGAVLSANVVDTSSAVDTDTSGNADIYWDCVKVGNGGGAFNQGLLDALNRATVTLTPGSWREVSN